MALWRIFFIWEKSIGKYYSTTTSPHFGKGNWPNLCLLPSATITADVRLPFVESKANGLSRIGEPACCSYFIVYRKREATEKILIFIVRLGCRGKNLDVHLVHARPHQACQKWHWARRGAGRNRVHYRCRALRREQRRVWLRRGWSVILELRRSISFSFFTPFLWVTKVTDRNTLAQMWQNNHPEFIVCLIYSLIHNDARLDFSTLCNIL